MYKIYRKVSDSLEYCFYIEATQPLSKQELKQIEWLVAETFEPEKTKSESFLGPSQLWKSVLVFQSRHRFHQMPWKSVEQ